MHQTTGVADPHCHTTASDGMVTPAELVAAAQAARIDLIAVTDHDTQRNTREAVARGEELGVAVIPGQEVTTAWPWQFHVVAWFVDEHIPGGMSLTDTVDAIHAQGGLAMIPHPFMPTRFASTQPSALDRLLESRRVDAIEVMHMAPMGKRRRRLLEEYCRVHADRVGAAIGSSDCHFGSQDIGRIVTRFPGRTTVDFRQAVEQRLTEPQRGENTRRVPMSMILRQQRRSLLELPAKRLLGRL